MCRLLTRPERRSVAALVLALATAGTAAAQSRSAPITIEANHGEVSQRTGKSVYTGNVVLTQADTTLRGDKLTVQRSDGRIHAVLTGDPARLKRTPEQGETVTGHARRMTYRSAEDMVELVGNAFIERGNNTLRSQTIRHNLATARTQAERGDDERVRITIQPDSGDGQDSDPASETGSGGDNNDQPRTEEASQGNDG